MGASVILHALLLSTASAAFHPGMSATVSADRSDYHEYEQSLYCDALRCIGADGRPLKMGSIVRADVCGSFCLCAGERVVRFDCPANLYFNAANGQCDFPQLAQCMPEFLTKEALEMYMHYNPDKMIRQSFDAEQWRRMWRCVDSFKNNKTMPNEIHPVDSEPITSSATKVIEVRETDSGSSLELSSTTKKPELKVNNTSSESNLSSSKSTETKPPPESKNTTSSADHSSLSSSSNADHKLSATLVEEKQNSQNKTSEKDEQLNAKKVPDSSELVDGKDKKISFVKADSNGPILKNNSKADSPSSESNDAATISTKLQPKSDLKKEEIKVTETKPEPSEIARTAGEKNTTDTSNSSSDRSSKDAMEAKRNEEPKVVLKKMPKPPALTAKSRFAIVPDKAKNGTSSSNANFFSTVVKLAKRIKSPFQEKQCQNSSSVERSRVNDTSSNASHNVSIEETNFTKPAIKDGKSSSLLGIKISALNQTKEDNVYKKNDLKNSKENPTFPKKISPNETASEIIPDEDTQKTRNAVNQLRSNAEHLPKIAKQGGNKINSNFAEDHSNKLLKLEKDAPKNNQNATESSMKVLKPNSKTDFAEEKLVRSQSAVVTNQNLNKTEAKKNFKTASRTSSAPSKNTNETILDIPPLDTTKKVDLQSIKSKEVAQLNQSSSAEAKKNETVKTRSKTTPAKVPQNEIDSSPKTREGPTPIQKKTQKITKMTTETPSNETVQKEENDVLSKDVSARKLNTKPAPKIMKLSSGEKDGKIKPILNPSSEDSEQKSANSTNERKSISVDKPVSSQIPPRLNITAIKEIAPEKVKISQETGAANKEKRPEIADLRLRKNADESHSEDTLSESTSFEESHEPPKNLPVKSLKDDRKKEEPLRIEQDLNSESSDVKPSNYKKDKNATSDEHSAEPVKNASEKILPSKMEQSLQREQNSSSLPRMNSEIAFSDTKKANSTREKNDKANANASLTLANQELMITEQNAAEEKIIAPKASSNADKPETKEFENKEKEENSSTGELLMKLRKALQDVYEKAASSNPQRTNHEHMTFKKRVRLLRKSQRGDAARRGKLHRISAARFSKQTL